MTTRHAACSCGQLRVTTEGEPIRISVCHCLACQRRTGSAFGVQARFAADAVTVRGESSQYARTGDEGGRAVFRFCPACGATVFWTFDGGNDWVAIPVGAFAEPSFPAPTVSVYEERRHAWVGLPDGIERID